MIYCARECSFRHVHYSFLEFVIARHVRKMKVVRYILTVRCPVKHDFSYHYLIKVHSRRQIMKLRVEKTIFKFTHCLLKIAPHGISENHFSKIFSPGGGNPPPIVSLKDAQCVPWPATLQQVFQAHLSRQHFGWNLLLKKPTDNPVWN